MNKSLGQWQAYVESGKTRQEQYARLQEAPEFMHQQIIGHMRTIKKIRGVNNGK